MLPLVAASPASAARELLPGCSEEAQLGTQDLPRLL